MIIFKLIIISTFVMILFIFRKVVKNGVKYIKSDIDGKMYLVRDVDDRQKAANMLARIKKNITKLITHLNANKSKYKDYEEYIDQLTHKIKGVVINESSADSIYTSYSVNKGEQIVFCLRSKKYINKMHRLNLVMYVAIHELAHVACPEYGHTELFKHIFAFLTQVSIDIGIYKKISFNSDPMEYCGLLITDSII